MKAVRCTAADQPPGAESPGRGDVGLRRAGRRVARIRHRLGPAGPQPGAFPFYVGLVICGGQPRHLVAGDARADGRHCRPSSLDREQAQARRCLLPADAAVRRRCSVTSGIYVATALYLVFVMRVAGRLQVWSPRSATALRDRRALLSRARDVVPGSAPEGSARSRPRPLLTVADAGPPMENFASLMHGFCVALTTYHVAADDRRRAAGHPGRRPARPRRAQRRVAAAAADLHHGPGRRRSSC